MANDDKWYSIKRTFEVSMELRHSIDQLYDELMVEITTGNGSVLVESLIDMPREKLTRC